MHDDGIRLIDNKIVVLYRYHYNWSLSFFPQFLYRVKMDILHSVLIPYLVLYTVHIYLWWAIDDDY